MADHVTIKEKDFARGIDARSAETELAPGFVEDAVNLDVVQGRMRKRTGYSHFASLPITVLEVYANKDTNSFELTLPSSVDLSTTPSGPVVLYGSVDTNDSDWDLTTTTQSLHYAYAYPVSTTLLPDPYTAPIVVDLDTFTDTNFSVYTAQKDNEDNENFFSHTISIDKSTYEVSIDYTPDGADVQAYVFFKDRSDSNIQTFSGVSSATITGASWSPSTTNIGIEVWEDTGTSYQRIFPDVAKIDDISTGNVTVQLTTTLDFRVILTAVDPVNSGSQVLAGESTLTINIPNAETPFLIPYVYTASGVELTLCEVESIVYDSATNSHNVTVINLDTAAFSLEYFWEYGDVVTNKLVVPNQSSVSPASSILYNNHQLVVYGLVPENIYKEDEDGKVNHIDGYIKEGVATAISSIHGNVFVEFTKDDITLPSLFPSINGRVSVDMWVGPAFHPAASSRRSGDVVSVDVDSTHQLPCVSVAWSSGNNVVYTLQATANSVSGTPIRAGDYLSVSQMSHSSLNGDFEVVSVTYNTNTIEITVENPNIIDSSFDDSGCGGFAGVFTDRVTLSSASPFPGAKFFLPGDSIEASGLSSLVPVVTSIESDSLVINGLTQLIQLSAGTKVSGSRTSNIIPLRDSLYVSTVGYMVPGDVVLNNKLILEVNARADYTPIVSGSTLSVPDSSYYVPGSQIILAKDGVYTVESVDSATSITLTEAPVLTGAVILGYTIRLHENALVEDCPECTVDVERRMYPATAPSTSSTLTSNKVAQVLPATEDSGLHPLRSTMVTDSMYFVDGNNMPLKLDGVNTMRPSLPNFNPIYSFRFVADAAGNFGQTSSVAFKKTQGYLEASGSSKLTVYYAANATYKATDVNNFNPGDYIRISASGEEMFAYVTHVEIVDAKLSGGGTNQVTEETVPSNTTSTAKVGYIHLDRGLVPASHAISEDFIITKCYFYKYYARLNYIDANRNVVASAASGYFDTIIKQAEAGKVSIKLILPPVFDIYDYDNLEIELYRTKGDGAVFYKVVTLPATFNKGAPYIEFIDTVRDEDLLTLDPTSIPIDGEVGVTFHGLPIANHITSINNSLVVGDITSEPELVVQIEKVNSLGALSDFSGKYIEMLEDSTGATGDKPIFEFVASTTWDIDYSKITQASGEVTFEQSSHGLSIGDWIYVKHYSTIAETAQPLIGWWQIVDKTASLFTITCTPSIAAFTSGKVTVTKASSSVRIPIYTGTDSSYSNSVGNSDTALIRLMYRFAQAFNAYQRAKDITISGQETFTPWAFAKHDDQRAGGITFTAPRYIPTKIGMKYPTLTNPSYYKFFANGELWTSGTAESEQVRYPSRVLASYQNYPELFDAPYALSARDSDSAIDVNPSDGQEITGIIPFFGDTAFGAALRGGVVVVFKQNSIYLIDLAVKAQGLNPVQKLETNGVGCSYPRSIAVSKEAIFFAHTSGVWALRRDLRIEFIGKYLERMFDEGSFSECHAHHSPARKSYFLSYGEDSATSNDACFVYNHSQEEDGQIGSWTRHTDMFASGWANLNAVELFSSNKGELFSINKTGLSVDFNDAGEAIESTLLCRIMDFGDSGIRKQVRHIFTHFRPITNLTDIALSVAVDTSTTFDSTTDFEITEAGRKKCQTIGHNLPMERGEYFQVKIVEGGLNEAMDVIGLDYMVLGLTHHGLPDAKSTKS